MDEKILDILNGDWQKWKKKGVWLISILTNGHGDHWVFFKSEGRLWLMGSDIPGYKVLIENYQFPFQIVFSESEREWVSSCIAVAKEYSLFIR